MMAVENAPAIADALLAGGRKPDTPVAVICDGSMPGERTVLSTLGAPRRRPRPRVGHAARDHRRRRRRRGGPPRALPLRPAMAELIEIGRPDGPAAGRLPRPARRRAAQAPRGRARAVPRRGREGRTPRGRGRLHRPARSSWRRAGSTASATCSRRPRRPATWCPRSWPRRSPASTCTAARWPRSSAARCPSLDDVLAEARSVLVLEDIVDHTNVGAIFRSRRGARLRRRPAGAALRRPALPPVDQGRDGRGVRAAVDPAAGLGTTPCRR